MTSNENISYKVLYFKNGAWKEVHINNFASAKDYYKEKKETYRRVELIKVKVTTTSKVLAS